MRRTLAVWNDDACAAGDTLPTRTLLASKTAARLLIPLAYFRESLYGTGQARWFCRQFSIRPGVFSLGSARLGDDKRPGEIQKLAGGGHIGPVVEHVVVELLDHIEDAPI